MGNRLRGEIGSKGCERFGVAKRGEDGFAGGMNQGRTIFSQLVSAIHPQQFARLARQFPRQRATRSLSAWEHFLAMAFAQVTLRESLRDLIVCLAARPGLRYQLGFRHPLARSTLADANERRDWRLFAALAEHLLQQARGLYVGDPTPLAELESIYALDASIIGLSLALCPWANWNGRDAAVKLHLLLDLRGSIPAWVRVSEAELYETRLLPEVPVEPGAYYLVDRGYHDFQTFYRWHQARAFFVARAKPNVCFRVRAWRRVDKHTGLRCDQTVCLSGRAAPRYPELLRRVHFHDAQNNQSLVFWTNQFALPALTIAELYRQRWQVELFFKWIKYNLRLRHFLGISDNAVRIQIWSAICVYALIAIAKKRFQLPHSLHQLLQVFSIAAGEKIPLTELFEPENAPHFDNQLTLTGI